MTYQPYNQGFSQSFPAISNEIRQEIQRFESVHPSIYAIYDLIEGITDPSLQGQIRDHVVSIEGNKIGCHYYHNYVNRCSSEIMSVIYNNNFELRLSLTFLSMKETQQNKSNNIYY